MTRRFCDASLLLLVSFVAGLLLANRDSRVDGSGRSGAGPEPAASRAAPGASHVSGRHADGFQPHRRAHHPGRRQHLVAAGRAPAGARSTRSSDRSSAIPTRFSAPAAGSRTAWAPASSSAATASSSPTITSSLAKRGASRSSSSMSPSRSPTSARCAPMSWASIQRPTSPC